jgi:glycosyltransferase involved in cell wall biosynthesis
VAPTFRSRGIILVSLGLERLGRRLYDATGWRAAAAFLAGPPDTGWLRPIAAAKDALTPRDAVLIHTSGVRHRARVLKIGRSLLEAGYTVAFLSKLSPRHRGSRVLVGEALGCPVLYFPDAHAVLRGALARAPALNWPLMVQYLHAYMWGYVRALRPRAIHTMSVASIGIGHDFRDRLRAEGYPTVWFHDFGEYSAGHLYRDDARPEAAEDLEWRRVVLELEAAHARCPDHAFTVSPALAAALAADYGLDPAPTVLLNAPRAADSSRPSRATIRHALRLSAETPLLVYAGGLTPHRGIDTLIAALARLPDAHLALIAQARTLYVFSLLDQARGAGCADRLHFHPYVAPEAVPGFLRDATIGVHPLTHYGNAEIALPNKLFDYLHAGLPMAVSDCRAMAGFVRGNGVGEVFAAGDPASLAETVRRILADPGRYRSRLASADLRQAYCWEREETALLEVYRRCLAG